MNKSIPGGMALAALLVLAAGCFRNTVSEMELAVPAMRSEDCARRVREAIGTLGTGPEGAIKEIRLDVEQRKAWVKFDNVRLGRRNVEVAVRHAGFAVNDLPADEDARAKLPRECRGDE
ncbi:MAG TPA: hypothetical protein PLJ99_07040 [Kiritimatiellia bacterium]|jgi:copper chaperone CopZ|nr:hypothetical protein [Kiritimatiellia bacterium]HPJ57407.1 hypothetical protein [Kiritimatiellia bacterium]HPR69029.1 hypothetical protein [Kiritimatiellia bacterium]HRX06880.1 hypothetical protein [Kiritimatiellia bacterium]